MVVFCPGEQGQPLKPRWLPLFLRPLGPPGTGDLLEVGDPWSRLRVRECVVAPFPPRNGGGVAPSPALLRALQQPLSSAADVGFPGDRSGGGSAWWGRASPRACAAEVAPPPDKISPEA